MAESFDIRAATEADMPAVEQLLWEVLWQPLGLPRDVRESFKLPGEEHIIVASAGGCIIGSAVIAAGADGVELRHLAVAQGSKGKGVGSALVLAAIEYCRGKNCLSLCTHARNTSQAFFEKHGFVAEGESLTHPAFEKYGITFRLMRRPA